MISVEKVSKSFGVVKALDSVSFQIERGSVAGLLGPNGAGKTTMMRLLTGFLAPTEGRVLLDGKDLTRIASRERRRVGYLPEHNPLDREMTVRDFLSFAASLKGIPFRARKRSIEEAAEACTIYPVLKRMIGKLSKGYQQRVGLAQALLGSPELLVLDEPTSGLDPAQIIEIRSLIRRIGETRTVLLSSHILPEVRMTCGKVLILNRGKLAAQGTCAELEHRLKGTCDFLVILSGDFSSGDEFFRFIPGVLDYKLQSEAGRTRCYVVTSEKGQEVRAQVAKAVMDAGFELLELKSSEWNLEDIFLKMISAEDQSAEAAAPQAAAPEK